MNFDDRIEELFIDLPEAPEEPELGAHISKSGKIVYLTGQYPSGEGRILYRGRVGLELTLDTGRAAARTTVIQALGVLRDSLGSLNKIRRFLNIRLYIATGAEFKDHQKILDHAMEFLIEIFGSYAKCATEVIGCASLPNGAACELAMTLEARS